MRSLLLLSLFSFSLFGALRAPESLGKVCIANMHDGFKVLKDGKLNHITSDCLDSTLRKMDFKQRNMYLIKGGSFYLNQANTGEYTLKSVANLKGGGIAGAAVGAKLGMFIVHFLGHGAILIAGACTGPAMPATILALEATFGPSIVVAGKAGAIAGGIIGGVSTGPV